MPACNKCPQLALNTLGSVVQNLSTFGVQNANLTGPEKYFGPAQLNKKEKQKQGI